MILKVTTLLLAFMGWSEIQTLMGYLIVPIGKFLVWYWYYIYVLLYCSYVFLQKESISLIIFTDKFHETVKEAIIPELFQKTERRGISQVILCYQHNFDSKTWQKLTISLMNIHAKILNKILVNRIQQYMNGIHDQVVNPKNMRLM